MMHVCICFQMTKKARMLAIFASGGARNSFAQTLINIRLK